MADAERPLVIDDAERLGVTRHGISVVRLIGVYSDGRRFSFDLPRPDAELDEESNVLTEKQQAIVAVVNEARVGDVLSNDEIARRAGYSATEDLRTFVRTLAAIGKLKKVSRGWQKT